MKIKANLPIYANATFVLDEKPSNWESLNKKEQQEYFFDNSDCEGSLCHQCSGPTETDYEVVLEFKTEEIKLYEG